MKNHIYYCTLRQVYTYSHCCRLCTCSLRVGLTVFIPESDTGAVLMIMVVDLYHDMCVFLCLAAGFWSLVFLVLTVQDYPKETLLMRKKKYICLIQRDKYLSGFRCQWIPRASMTIIYSTVVVFKERCIRILRLFPSRVGMESLFLSWKAIHL